MAIVAVAGDACTTTTVAIAAAWPATNDVVIVHAPSRTLLAAWFDMPISPSLSTVVTSVLDGAWTEVERHTRLADNGTRLIPAPARAAEASQAISESAKTLVPVLATLRTPVDLADTGRLPPVATDHPFVTSASVVVLVHRQAPQSARAAAVRLQRLADRLERFATVPTVVAVVGGAPYGLDEIERFVQQIASDVPTVALPVDELAASVLGGRTGVSERRLARLPLMRASRDLAAATEHLVANTTGQLWRAAR